MQKPASKPQSKLIKRILIFSALGIGLVVSFPFLTLAFLLAQDSWQEWQRCRGYTQFNANTWQNESLIAEPRFVRSCMVDDLLERKRLVGQSRGEVTKLLGQPEPANSFADYDLVYFLGPERSFISMDGEWLGLKLDPAGRVSEARLMTN